MFRPDGTQLFVRRELTTIGLRRGFVNDDSSSALN